ncbi:MAG: DNA-3-methyladenine glycosylase 2 family protein [Bauldia sp.]
MRRIDSPADVAEGIQFLRTRDPRLHPVIEAAGAIPLRRLSPGFAGLAQVVVSQQLSAAAATTIWTRLVQQLDPVDEHSIAAAEESELRAAGLSRPKIRTLKALSHACRSGLMLHELADRPAETLRAALTAVTGIGPWTADIYLLFCLGHPDIFPVGDLALQNAAQLALGLPERPGPARLAEESARWTPWRGVAARLLWAYWGSVPKPAKTPASANGA